MIKAYIYSTSFFRFACFCLGFIVVPREERISCIQALYIEKGKHCAWPISVIVVKAAVCTTGCPLGREGEGGVVFYNLSKTTCSQGVQSGG